MAKKQLALFTPSFLPTVSVKNEQDLMQYPFFSLSKRKRLTGIDYDDGRVQIKVHGLEEHGLANIFDADILIYVASQLMAAKNRGCKTSPEIQVSGYEMLNFIGKATGGKSYQQLKNALDRLQGTQVITSIRQGSRQKRHVFSWISDWTVVEKDGRPSSIRFTLNNWLYEAIVSENLVLTIDREYFELVGGLERGLYNLCRKVAGTTGQVQMKLDTVRYRMQILDKPGRFRSKVESLCQKDAIPSYWCFVTQRNNEAKDWYFCAFPRSVFKERLQAFNTITFRYLERLALKDPN